MRLPLSLVMVAIVLSLVGCHSRYIETTVTNHTTAPILLIEVDYPSASFGTQDLAPGATFRYRFKILGSGSTKLIYTDAAHHDHTSSGPALQEGSEGSLNIVFDSTGPQWQLNLRPPS